MLTFGCNVSMDRRYEQDVEFARSNGFAFFQIGYTADGFVYMNEQDTPCLATLIRVAFPVTIHALLRVSEFDQHLPRLLEATQALHCRELIIHPISQTRELGSTALSELIDGIGDALKLFRPHGISLCLENNSGLDILFSTVEDVQTMFVAHPDLEFLLDVAHVNDYEALCRLADIRMPKVLHVADRRLGAVHEHLPVGQGDIDFAGIMTGPLAGFQGKVIFEVPWDDRSRVDAVVQWRRMLSSG